MANHFPAIRFHEKLRKPLHMHEDLKKSTIKKSCFEKLCFLTNVQTCFCKKKRMKNKSETLYQIILKDTKFLFQRDQQQNGEEWNSRNQTRRERLKSALYLRLK